MRQVMMMRLIIVLISMTVIEGFNISQTRSGQCQVRLKRETAPDILEIKYHYENRVEMQVLQRVLDTTLDPNFLPMVCIDEDDEADQNQLLGVDPIFYHGVNSFSAITYFPHDDTLHGVIGHRFYIENLPRKDANNPDVVDNYKHLISKTSSGVREHSELNYSGDRTQNKRKLELDDAIPRKKFKKYQSKHDAEEILYPEILLVVDVSSRINDTNFSVERYDDVMMYVLAYWNAVDMLFRQLKRTNIRISLAGILIGKTADFIDYMINDVDYSVEQSKVYIPKEEALNELGKYFYQQTRFKRDSFDFLIWMTRATLINDHNSRQEIHGNLGIAAPPAQCGGLHFDEFVEKTISNRAIVMHDDHYADYQLAARELAHLMFVADDDVEIFNEGHQSNCMPPNPSIQTSGIMDPVNKQIEDSLLWSYCSEIHFERYANSISSCCLLNFPYRTMIRPKIPIQTLTEKKQCQCYGMEAYHQKCKHDACGKPLKCRNWDQKYIEVALPLDGTPCVAGSNGNICIDGECV